MAKLTFTIFALLLTQFLFAQVPINDTANTSSEYILDTSFLKMLDSATAAKSYVNITLGVGNKLFSQKNNAFNANQAQVKKIYYTPTVSYHNKSGVSLGITPYITNDSGALKVYQTAITPTYDYANNEVSTGFSYTRYFSDYKNYNTNAVYQNDFYGYFSYQKSYVIPTLSAGYSTGTFKEINLDTLRIGGLSRPVKDSTTNKIKSFSLSAGIEHSFDVANIFTKSDGISFTPQFLLQAGSEKFATTHTNKAFERFVARSKRFNSTTINNNAGFTLQSLALSLDAIYSIGKFFIDPNVYIDYYLPETTEKRLTTVFSVSLGVSL